MGFGIVNKIDVPLNWIEIDEIILSLRMTNKVFTGNIRSELEEKLNKYSLIAKEKLNER